MNPSRANRPDNPMRALANGAGRTRWVCCAMDGTYLADVSAEQLADALVHVADAVRAGSELVTDWPPPMTFDLRGPTGEIVKIPCRWRRADIGKLEPVADRLGLVQELGAKTG